MELALVSPILAAMSKAASVINKLMIVTKNKKNFEVLANRIKSLTAILERLNTMGIPFQGALRTGVSEFTLALDSAEELLIEYGISSRAERFFRASSLKSKFRRVHKQLKNAERQLTLALNVEQMCPVRDGNMRGDLMPYRGGGGRGAGVGYSSGYPSPAVVPYQGGYASGGPRAIGIAAVEASCLTPDGILTAREVVITTVDDDSDDDFNNFFFFE
ncbi:hypothetical protein ACEWY4_012056 [Coilia grayii]|uniref:Mixed lineage kinase domain-containing protein n=1 Tax=Coilia grayii TaxID=363190 RepID=A0ABD1JZI6_9TELE